MSLKREQRMGRFFLFMLAGMYACDTYEGPGVIYGGLETGIDVDQDAPVIEHQPIDSAQPYATAVDITAFVEDELSEVFVVQVYFKQETSTMWDSAALAPEGDGNYKGKIPAASVGSAGMNYYLSAVASENNTGYLPHDAENGAWHFRVTDD